MDRLKTDIRTGETALSHAVIENVAGRKGTEALMEDPPLYEVLDLDALDVLFAGREDARGDEKLSFEHGGCTVTVSSDGHVLVEDVEDGSAGEPATA